MRAFVFLGCLFASSAAFTAGAAAQDDAWAREVTLSAGLGYAAPAGTFAAELEWLPMPILALAGSLGTDGSGANGAAALRLQIPADSLAVGIGLGGAIDALTFTGPEATTELHLAWRDGDGLAVRVYAGFAHPVSSASSSSKSAGEPTDEDASEPEPERRAYAGASLGWSF